MRSLVFGWLILTVLSVTIAVFSLDWVTYYDLAKHGIRTDALVTAKEPENHQFIRYSYSVDGKQYSGLGDAGKGNPEFDNINIGDSIIAYYAPKKPEVSFSGDPTAQLSSVSRGVVFISLVLPVLILVGMRLARRRCTASH